MEKVNDDDRKGQFSPFILSRNREQFILGRIAKFALPETRCPFRQHGDMPSSISIVGHDLAWSITDCDPIINLGGSLCHPASGGCTEFHAAYGGIIPQKAIASGRKQKGYRDLSITLDEVNDAALLVKSAVLMLSEAINMLTIIGREIDLSKEHVTLYALIMTRWNR